MTAEEGDSGIDEIVEDLLYKNRERKRLQAEAYKSCTAGLDRSNLQDFLLIESKDAHEGIAGIACGRIKDTYYRPSAILTPTGSHGELLKGTGRSIDGVNLYQLLKKHEDLFEKFGGHGAACGFTMKKENLEPLREGLLADMAELAASDPELFVRKYPVDMKLDMGDIDIAFAEQLELLAPFGNGNPKPLFEITNVTMEDVRFMGNENQHVRFMAFDREGKGVQCVLFNHAADYGMLYYTKRPFDLIGHLECQIWQGAKRLQFMVEKIRFD